MPHTASQSIFALSRSTFAMLSLALAVAFAPGAARADDAAPGRHAIAMHGAPALAADFAHFGYANPDAPKGGTITLGVLGTFDSLNPLIIKGNAAAGLRGYVYESLLARALDEPFSLYGHIAERIEMPEDRTSITFHLTDTARFSDGEPLTVEDVIFSHALLRDQGRPNHRSFYSKVSSVERVGPRGVRFVFDAQGDREIPLILGLMPILPKHATDPTTFGETSLKAPIGSGPYVVESVDAGTRIVYRRNPDYWAADRPARRGHFNFDRVVFDYYRDDSAMMEAFRKGLIDVRGEGDPGRWANSYTGPAFDDGRIVKRAFAVGLPSGMNAFAFNTRRAPFDNPRVRRALIDLFDFTWANTALYHGLYTRTRSYFDRSELSSSGRPADATERQLLAPFATTFEGPVGQAVLEGAYPLTDTADRRERRTVERAAFDQLRAAGFTASGGQLLRPDGQPFAIELLAVTREQERLFLSYVRTLKRLGIAAEVRQIDAAIYQRRLQSWDFDMVQRAWGASLSPGNEQSFRWSSKAAETEGTFNYPGVKSPAVDAMIEAVLAARDRPAFVSAVRALDRALLAGDYVVPLFHLKEQWVAHQSWLGVPEATSLYGYQIDTWWDGRLTN